MTDHAPSDQLPSQNQPEADTMKLTTSTHDQAPTAAQPLSPPQSGLSSVAQFLPSDAKVDHSTPPPSQPLTTGAADIQGDVTMSEGSAGSTVTAPLQPELQSQSQPQQVEHSDPPTNGVHPLPHPDKPDQIPGAGDDMALDSSDAAASAPQTSSLSTTVEVSAPTDIKSSSDLPLHPRPVGSDAGEPMSEVPTAGVTRPRDDDETMDEPSAKRARTVEPPAAIEQAEFRKPEIPVSTTATPAPVTTSASSHLPPRPVFSREPIKIGQKKVLEEKMKNTKKVKSAIAFLKPVDYVALNIPNYPNIIQNPMDLSTMEYKLKHDQYGSLEDFVADFELMVNNCFTFNGPAHAVSGMAQNLRAYFIKQMDNVPSGQAAAALPQKPPPPPKRGSPTAKPPPPRRESRASLGALPSPGIGAGGETFALLPGGTPQIRRDSTAGRPKRAVVPPAPRDLPYSGAKPKRKENQVGLKFCESVLDELRKPRYDPMTIFFREPVDPVALNIPTYYSVIKHPMDLQTLTNKLKGGLYSTAEEFKSDAELIFSNAFKFNPPENLVHVRAAELRKEFLLLWSDKNAWEKRNQTQSRRASDASEGESEAEESAEEDEGDDEKEATIAQLKDQLAAMQNMLGNLTGPKRASPKAGGKKKKKSSGAAKSKKAASTAPRVGPPATKAKPKKQRLVSYEEKQEISNATEHMNAAQVEKLTQIITENVAKYKVSCAYRDGLLHLD